MKKKPEILYRMAEPDDADRIAWLHIHSWRIHYKGLWPQEFLEGPVEEDRLSTWRNRMAEGNKDRRVLLAEHGKQLVGFCCTFLHHDTSYGSLLDNIHVSPEFQGLQIGRSLMQDSAQWVLDNSSSDMYLWVLEGNEGAFKFYERLGGICKERKADDIPTGGQSWVWRYYWEDAQHLLV